MMNSNSRLNRSTFKAESASAPTRTARRFAFNRKSSIPPPSQPSPQAKRPTAATGEAVPNRGELQKIFKKFDANSDGKISLAEFRGVVSSLGRNASDEEVNNMMKEADSDGDGFINFDEFMAVNTKGLNPARVLKDLETAFKMYDLDKSGSISVDELHKVMRSLGEEASLKECKRMINGADIDQNGSVSFEEFKNMMMSARQ